MFYSNLKDIADGAPGEDTIQNDVLLDRWIKEYNLKKKAERTGSSKSKKSASDHNQMISFNRG